MGENQTEGGAGPALGAHSKDAPALSPASSAGGDDSRGGGAGEAGGISDTASRLAGQARDAAGQVAHSVSSAAGQVGRQVSKQAAGSMGQVAEFVRENPFTALVAAFGFGLALGVSLARR